MFPHARTVPSLRKAAQKSPPTLKEMALVKLGGTFVCWNVLLPQTTAVPSARNTPALLRRAETAMTLLNPAGTLVTLELRPQQATAPSGLKPNPWLSPAAMATAFVKASGNNSWDGVLGPMFVAPHARMLPSSSEAGALVTLSETFVTIT